MTLRTVLLAIYAVVCPVTLTVRAADDEPWKSLFNGSDFAGWKVVALRDPAPAVVEECIGPTIKVWVNGVPTCNLVDEKYREAYIAFKIHSVGDKPKATGSAIRLRNIRILTENLEKYAKPMDLESRRASTVPGEYDKASP